VRIAVLGAGHIGATLAHAFAAAGHDVAVGSRTPAGRDDGLPVTDVAGALAGADVAVLAVPGPAVAAVLAEHGAALAGVLVVDAANVIPGARYARAFNTVGFENLRDPHFGADVADLLVSCTDDDLPVVEALVRAVGLRPVTLGPDAEDALDDALRLWFALSRRHGRHVALKVLADSSPST